MALSQAINSKLYCNVCEVILASKANYALHVLTQEHCENLIRMGKPKPEPESIKIEGTSSDIECDTEISNATPVTDSDTMSTSIPAYGCFVDGELCSTNEACKELEYKYVHYSQSIAESPCDGQVVPTSEVITTDPTVPIFSKKITKSLISCEVCNVILTTIPDYDFHVNSPQHIWNMKFRKMGATAHFVKTGTDTHITNGVELSVSSRQETKPDLRQLTPIIEGLKPNPFPVLYCDACELLLNTPQQFNSHVNGNTHKLCVQKKGKMKVKKEQFPTPDKYYCYSCKVALNSILQFSEHKTGRKHKVRCTQLVTLGFTIPIEEQLPEWNLPEIDPDKPVRYPEFYEKFVLAKQRGQLGKSSNLKELMMNESDCESNEYVNALDIAIPTDIPNKMQNLTIKSESPLSHIYRIQVKSG